MIEYFPTPEAPEDAIITCEECKNFIYVRERSFKKEAVLDCPLCGALNRTSFEPEQIIYGRLTLTGPVVQTKWSEKQRQYSLPEMPEKVREALLKLLQGEWAISFTIDKKSLPKDLKPSGEVDDENEDVITTCEDCGNFIYSPAKVLRKSLVQLCPLCGCINRVNKGGDKLLHGRISMTSPVIASSSYEKGIFQMPEMSNRVQQAVVQLMREDWSIRFDLEDD